MYELKVNLVELREKFKVHQDNVAVFDVLVRAPRGRILVIDPRKYEDQLNEFGIFYTKKAR